MNFIIFSNCNHGQERSDDPSEVICYLDFPIGVHINIMAYVCPIKEFARSALHCAELKRFKRMRMNKTLREYGYPVEIPDDPNISMI